MAFFSNFFDRCFPKVRPIKVKVALTIEKIRKPICKFVLDRPKANPTEKLSMLTAKEKIMMEAILVMVPLFSSFLEVYISMANIKKTIPTITLELLIIKSKFLPIIDPNKGIK